jgi:hypothetical protein
MYERFTDRTRQQVIELLHGYQGQQEDSASAPASGAAPDE